MDGIYFFIFVVGFALAMLAAYMTVKYFAGGGRPDDKAAVSYPKTVAEMSDRNNYAAKQAGSAYIQNNAAAISKKICILTPTFNADSFLDLAKQIFSDLTSDKGTARLSGVVDDNIDLSQLPDKINKYDHCYLHKLILSEDTEKIVVLLNVDNGESPLAERYFAVFSRKSSLKNITSGGVIAVSCPSCGAALSFEQKALKICPYCGKPVKYAEYDWVLISVERITNETVIDNRAIVEERS